MKWIYISILFLFAVHAAQSEISAAAKSKLHLEDLLIWKISDELKLSSEQEKKVSDVIKKINKKKSENSIAIQELTEKIIKSSNEEAKLSAFNELKKKLQIHGSIAIEELDQIKGVLGVKKLGEYLELKNDISEKVKSLIIPTDKKGGKKLPPPKVIEE